jgi:putative nucleotidyltransferase with HDIG domain
VTEEEAARQVLRKIEERGHTALIVGGAVRDHLLGSPMHDIDIVTDLPVDELRTLFRAHDVGKSRAFAISVVLWGGWSFDVAHFRGATRFTEDGRSAGLDPSPSFAEDARHRDFTVNAMGLDLRGALRDPWGGREDLRRRLLRGVENPALRFEEDPLRLLRAVRFLVRFDFELEPETEAALRQRADQVRLVAPERIGDELARMASEPGSQFAAAVRAMDRLELLRHVLPEVAALRGMSHDALHHPEGDVFEHTLAACEASRSSDPLVHLAVLLHDIGKPLTHAVRRGRHTYFGHAEKGAELATEVADRLRYSRRWREALRFSVLNHLKVPKLASMRPSKIYRLVVHEDWPLLKEVSYCDQAARGRSFDPQRFEEETQRAEDSARSWRDALAGRSHGKPMISGRRVLELTGLPPGPEIGRLLREVTDWAMDHGATDPAVIEAELLRLVRTERRGPHHDGSDG